MIGQKSPVESIEHFEELRRLHPGNPEVLFPIALGRIGRGQLDQARQILDELPPASREDIRYLLARGLIALEARELAESEDWLRRALKLAPDHAAIHLSLCRCLTLAGRTADAKQQQQQFEKIAAEVRRQREEQLKKRQPVPRPFWIADLRPPVPHKGKRDVTAQSGIDFTYRNGEEAEQYSILESLGGGIALLDYDGDGRLDVFVTGGGYYDGPKKTELKGYPCKLYRNLGNWKFQDVTADVGLDGVKWWYTHGATVADYDRDGWPDLLVTGYGKVMLFRNSPHTQGRRRFLDVTESMGLQDDAWSTSAGWGDVDGDGFPVLYVCHYVDWSFRNHPPCNAINRREKRDICPPQFFQSLPHLLFRNQKGQRLQVDTDFKAKGRGLGILVDVDNDGWEDLVIANGHAMRNPHLGSTTAQCPHLLRNLDATGRRVFKDISRQGGEFFQTQRMGRGLASATSTTMGAPISSSVTPIALW